MAHRQRVSLGAEDAPKLLSFIKRATCSGLLAGLVLAATSGTHNPVLAQGPFPDNEAAALDGFASDPSTWDDAALTVFADQVRANVVSSTDTLAVFDALSPAQRDVVTARLAELAGVSFSEFQAEVAGNQANHLTRVDGLSEVWPSSPLIGEGTLDGPGAAYVANVPPLSDMSQTDPNVLTSSYVWDPTCDGPDPDGDFRFFASPFAAVDGPRMRWFTYNSLVTWALSTAYPQGLRTYGSHSYEIYVCLGDRGTNLAGGPMQVVGALRMKFR